MECPATSWVVSMYYFWQRRIFDVLLGFLGNGSRSDVLMVFGIHFSALHGVMDL
jgi:hypothetical protein